MKRYIYIAVLMLIMGSWAGNVVYYHGSLLHGTGYETIKFLQPVKLTEIASDEFDKFSDRLSILIGSEALRTGKTAEIVSKYQTFKGVALNDEAADSFS